MAIAPQHTPLQASDSQEEARWLRTRESSDAPSEPSTPATSHFRDNNTPSGARSRSDSTSVAQPALNIDAEDEDVKIAIMALGAMKNLDGSSRSRGRSIDGGAGPSSRSVSSTTISSPSSSTPATDQTAYTLASSSTSTSSSTPATLADLPPDFRFPAIVYDENGNEMRVDREDLNDADFLQRVSHLPIVRGTLRAYEMGKQRSRVMRYGGNLVESSVKAISRPVVSRIGAHLGGRGVEQLDDFACRQLDRIYPYASDRFSKEERETVGMELEEKERTEWQDMSEEERVKRRQAYMAQKLEERERAALLRDSAANASSQQHQQSGGYPVAQHSGMPARSSSYSASMDQQQAKGVQNRQRDRSASDMQRNALIRAHSDNPASRTGSGWSSMLVEAGVTAGGLSAAMSEESMKSLKYCLQWLQYATAHIEHQITILRDLIVKLNHGELDLTSPAAENLSNIKRDVVLTIRNVVDVVGKYAGGALPEPARASVKAFILSLPARWATVNRASNGIEGRSGAFGGSPSSPSFSALHSSQGNGSSTSAAPEGRQTAGTVARQQAAATAAAANRILTLAVESLDILRSVTVVFGESLDRADLWVERLRVLGLQRKRAHEQAAAEEAAARIDAGMGGALARSGHWELSRGMHLHGSQSPGAESNMSISTSASSKRRRVKRRNTLRGSTSPFAAESRSPAPEEEDEGAQSEEGSSTETERAAMARSHSSSSHPSSSAGAGLSSAHQHFQHPHGSTMAHRRAAVKARGNGGRHPSSAVRASPVSTVSGTTPALQELSLRDSPSAPDSTTKKS